MIIGIVPIGGKGTRLGLTFSKEMLPQKNFQYYNPIANHLVSKMLEAGASKIIFVHGFEAKKDVTSYFVSETFVHLVQKNTGFANVLKEVIDANYITSEDTILFGMPDTIFEDNPFLQLVKEDNICCALFKTNSTSKVDRLSLHNNLFVIKSEKTEDVSSYFWGVIKFDGKSLLKAYNSQLFGIHTEIGALLNALGFNYKTFGRYIDLGTWPNYNRYLSHDYY